MNSWQDWYFQTTSQIITLDEDNQRVGILNTAPAFTLDVNGEISASNVITVNTISDNIEASTGIIDTMNTINISALSNVNALHLQASSNLKILNTWINNECPIPNQGSLFGFSLGGGWIDPSWIKSDTDWEAFLSSAWNALQTGYDLFTLVRSIFDEQGNLADDLKEALDEALNDGSLRVDWDNLNNKPIYASKTTKDIGISGDVYINDSKTFYALNSAKFSSIGDNGNLQVVDTVGKEKFLNVGSLELFMKEITSSNMTASNLTASNVLIKSNVDVPRITASNTITSNATIIDTLRIGNFYIQPNGIYVGNPIFPLSSVQVIDNVGNYKGTIDKNQITNLEAFQLKAAADGQLIWGEFGNTNAINDVFATQNPLYNV